MKSSLLHMLITFKKRHSNGTRFRKKLTKNYKKIVKNILFGDKSQIKYVIITLQILHNIRHNLPTFKYLGCIQNCMTLLRNSYYVIRKYYMESQETSNLTQNQYRQIDCQCFVPLWYLLATSGAREPILKKNKIYIFELEE